MLIYLKFIYKKNKISHALTLTLSQLKCLHAWPDDSVRTATQNK